MLVHSFDVVDSVRYAKSLHYCLIGCPPERMSEGIPTEQKGHLVC